MPASKRPRPLYQRGDFKLYPARPGRTALEIVWYDTAARRERSASSGTNDDGAARLELDRRYLRTIGQRLCGECGRPMEGDGAPLLTRAIADYLLTCRGKASFRSIRARLGHVVEYIAATSLDVTVLLIDPAWVEAFRAWHLARPIVSPSGVKRRRSLSAVEGSVLQLAAAINATGHRPRFKALQATTVAESPTYRADVPKLAAMFRFCLYPPAPEGREWSDKERAMVIATRAPLLRYLRAAVATWARPEEIYDLGEGQYVAAAGVLDLNRPGRRQTRKYRTRVPVARQFAPHLVSFGESYMQVTTVKASWNKMRPAIGLPLKRGQAAEKLIRRSMATLVRRAIGEAQFRQVQMMLGHEKGGVSDIYAIPDPANLGLALAATEEVIDQIEALCPGAYRQLATTLRVVSGGRP